MTFETSDILVSLFLLTVWLYMNVENDIFVYQITT